MNILNMRIFIISIIIASIFAIALVYFSGLPFWGALLIVVGAMVVNGLIAEKEDEMPGGFLNPDGTNPEWPITVTFEDGSKEEYKNEKDLECNLEFFNSKLDAKCEVRDASGSELMLVLNQLEIKELRKIN